MKKVLSRRVARSLLVGTVIPLINVTLLPRSRPVVAGLSTMTAPNMYGWMLHVKTYSPGVVNVTESPPLRGSVVNGMFAAPAGNTRLERVWTVFEFPEKLTRTPGVATASERVPAISTPVSNHRPGLSVIEKLTSLPPARTTADAARAAKPPTTRQVTSHFLFLTCSDISHPPCPQLGKAVDVKSGLESSIGCRSVRGPALAPARNTALSGLGITDRKRQPRRAASSDIP